MLQLFVMSRFTHSKYIEEVPKLKSSVPGTDTHRLGYFVIREMGLVKVYSVSLFVHQI